ncbi:hypothetical protein [Streptomyces sp. NPDC102487]|uniref:hypothetical protein n=1 Tax=Streptomyces sp. NPDC102487 TaxID=3366182 RepID=UPI0037F6B735
MNNTFVTDRAFGPVVLLAHGFDCGQTLWWLGVPTLDRDYRVVSAPQATAAAVTEFIGAAR